MAEIDNLDIADFEQSVARNAPNEAVREAIYELLRFAKNNSNRIKGGAAEYGSFHYQIDIYNQTLTLFTCDAVGYVSVSLGNFVQRPPIIPSRLIVRLRSTLARIPGFDSFSKDYPDRPGFIIAQTIVNPDVMGRFQKAVCRFQQDIQAL